MSHIQDTTSPQQSRLIAIASMSGSILSIQLGAAIAKNLFPILGAREVTALRLAIAALMLCAFHRPWRTSLRRTERRFVVVYGVIIGIMNLLFYMALARIPLGVAVALEFTGPLSVALLSSRHAVDFVWAILAACGIVLLLPLTSFTAPLDPIGVLYALGAGVCWGLYIIVGRRAGSTIPGGIVTSWGMLIGAIVAIPLCLINATPFALNAKLLGMATLVAFLSSALPYSLEMVALPRLPAKTFSIFMSVEPAVAALLGLMILGEQLAPIQWIAILCIIAASVGSTATGTPAVIHD